jgi:hypothetical protein
MRNRASMPPSGDRLLSASYLTLDALLLLLELHKGQCVLVVGVGAPSRCFSRRLDAGALALHLAFTLGMASGEVGVNTIRR